MEELSCKLPKAAGFDWIFYDFSKRVDFVEE